MLNIFHRLMGDANAREVEKIKPLVTTINGLEPQMQALSTEELRDQTRRLRERLAQGASLEDVLPEAFAAVREASRRVLGMRHFDVQLIGGVAMHRGMISEMRTGEGKTLVATCPMYLNALSGKGTHLITVNDYLSRRDSVWMGKVYHALGMTVGCIQHQTSFLFDPDFKVEEKIEPTVTLDGSSSVVATESFRVDMDCLRPCTRREAYEADITYGTNNEFGFDYLRDNMVARVTDMVQRDLHFALVDEVDSILIDEARTPLIISAPAEEAADTYYRFADLVGQLVAKEDYEVDEKLKAATLTASGITKMENWLQIENLYIQGGSRLVHHMEQALRAHALFKRDRDYVVKDGEVVIVDEFTGRLMLGRRYSEGLHQAIEAKERVPIQRESITLATITFQNYFRLYAKLAGMTGTAMTEAEEFHKIYKLEVLAIPTHRDNHRVDLPDRVYKNELGKFKAVIREIKMRHATGQPVLVGTVSIEKNELLGMMLEAEGIPFSLLNAKNHEREAEIIAQAGRKGAVTIATNMAGRGVDIILGGNPPEVAQTEEVRALGGLIVIGTERHESRRIDNQLRGRAGRQGDPGATQFYVSMEDDLMRIFGSDRMKGMMDRLGVPEDEPIEHGVLSRSIAAAQRKVEGHHFDIRKHLLDYDDVLNKHRLVIYRKRREMLDKAQLPTQEGERPLRALVLEMVDATLQGLVSFHTPGEDVRAWDIETIERMMSAVFPAGVTLPTLEHPTVEFESKEAAIETRAKMIEALQVAGREAYVAVENAVGDQVLMAEIEKAALLRSTDDLWIEHLEAMDHLRHGIGLQGYGQRDPLVEYKREAYRMFNEFQRAVQERVTQIVFKVQVAKQIAEQEVRQSSMLDRPLQLSAPAKEMEDGPRLATPSSTLFTSVGSSAEKTSPAKEIGRNELCPCGSGKKYKKCHGA